VGRYNEHLLNSRRCPTVEVTLVARFSTDSVSSVAVATGYGRGDRRTEVPFSAERRHICLVNRVQAGPGTYSPSYQQRVDKHVPVNTQQWKLCSLWVMLQLDAR
jgi:hypothetical protein